MGDRSSGAEPVQGFRFSAEGYSYTFQKGDKLVVIADTLYLCKDPAFKDRLHEGGGPSGIYLYASQGDTVVAQDLKGRAIAVTYEKKGERVTGWTDAYWLKPVNAENPPHTHKRPKATSTDIVLVLLMLVVPGSAPFIIRAVFGRRIAAGCVVVLIASCLVSAVFAVFLGKWLGVLVLVGLAACCLPVLAVVRR
jgi:hypothetical protein